mmetsp:Transcript_7085/g.13842  ORF Transcript_7085/g.13842 Transcript_7085/m.13842 type:complete len:266 (+) Transcript_7085:882-1679(+)
MPPGTDSYSQAPNQISTQIALGTRQRVPRCKAQFASVDIPSQLSPRLVGIVIYPHDEFATVEASHSRNVPTCAQSYRPLSEHIHPPCINLPTPLHPSSPIKAIYSDYGVNACFQSPNCNCVAIGTCGHRPPASVSRLSVDIIPVLNPCTSKTLINSGISSIRAPGIVAIRPHHEDCASTIKSNSLTSCVTGSSPNYGASVRTPRPRLTTIVVGVVVSLHNAANPCRWRTNCHQVSVGSSGRQCQRFDCSVSSPKLGMNFMTTSLI